MKEKVFGFYPLPPKCAWVTSYENDFNQHRDTDSIENFKLIGRSAIHNLNESQTSCLNSSKKYSKKLKDSHLTPWTTKPFEVSKIKLDLKKIRTESPIPHYKETKGRPQSASTFRSKISENRTESPISHYKETKERPQSALTFRPKISENRRPASVCGKISNDINSNSKHISFQLDSRRKPKSNFMNDVKYDSAETNESDVTNNKIKSEEGGQELILNPDENGDDEADHTNNDISTAFNYQSKNDDILRDIESKGTNNDILKTHETEKTKWANAIQNYGWKAEVHGDPFGLKASILKPRPNYVFKMPFTKVAQYPANHHMENYDTFFSNTIPIKLMSFEVHPEWESEILLEKRRKRQEKLKKEGQRPYRTSQFSFAY